MGTPMALLTMTTNWQNVMARPDCTIISLLVATFGLACRATVIQPLHYSQIIRISISDPFGEPCEVRMNGEPAYFDLQTVALLRETFEDAWASLRPEQRAMTPKSVLAERILKAAAQGERNRNLLLDAALNGVATEDAA